jgi:hypothetical protein
MYGDDHLPLPCPRLTCLLLLLLLHSPLCSHRYLAGSAAATRAQADGVLTRPTGDPHHQATDAHSA